MNYSYIEQVLDIVPTIVLTAVMGACVYCVVLLPIHSVYKLLIQVPLGILIYVAGSALLRLDSFNYILSVLKSHIKKK